MEVVICIYVLLEVLLFTTPINVPLFSVNSQLVGSQNVCMKKNVLFLYAKHFNTGQDMLVL